MNNAKPAEMDLLEIDLETIPSATLRRLIEEVRNETFNGVPRVYDRWYNRHNRS